MNNTDQALATLVSRFGQSAPELWAAMVASQRLEAIVFLVVFSAIAVAAILIMRRLAADSNDDAAVVWIGGSVVGILVGLLISAIACMSISSLVYPEASALKALTSSRR